MRLLIQRQTRSLRNPRRKGLLKSFLKLDVPEPAFAHGKQFVVAVLESAGDERRVFVEHVLHTKRDRRST